MIGAVFIALAIFLGARSLALINLLPLAVLGILLLFAGGELCLTILDLTTRKDLFVSVVVLGITLAANLAAGFIAGIAVAYLLKYGKLSV
jgi:SulP family sulfate permease